MCRNIELNNNCICLFCTSAHQHHCCTVASVDSTLHGQCWPRIWCPAWCCFLQEEGEQSKIKTGHLQICQGSSSDPPFCPWGEHTPEEAVSPSFYPPTSVLALLSLGHVLLSNTPLFPLMSNFRHLLFIFHFLAFIHIFLTLFISIRHLFVFFTYLSYKNITDHFYRHTALNFYS